MSYRLPIGDKDVLQRRQQPVTQRYDGAQAVVETGLTADVARFIREHEVKLKRQPGELFRRVRASAVAECVERANNEVSGGAPVRLADGGFAKPMDEYGGSGSGNGARRNSDSAFSATAISGNMPTFNECLLLDCRDAVDYEKCHIIGALHYSRMKLNHSTNPFLAEMHAFKNKDGKYIVLYDLDESVAPEMANIIYQKGVDNVGMIAGGIAEFVQEHSRWVTGEPPVLIVPRDERMKRRANEASKARSEARSTTSSHKPKSLSSSLAKPQGRRAFH